MRSLDMNKLEETKDFIANYQIKFGKSPSYRTIQKELNYSGLASVQRYMTWLYANGWVQKDELARG